MLEKLSKFLQAKRDRAWPGEEVDPVPMSPPVGYKKQPTIWEQQRALIRSEISRQAQDAGFETFEESDDFEVGDDFDPQTPYEADFEPPTAEVQKAFSPPPVNPPGGRASPPAPAQPAAPTAPPAPPKAP